MHCIPIHSIANAFHRNGIHTIAMDTYGVDAHGVAAAGGRVAGTTWLFPWRIRGKTAARAAKPAPLRAANRPFAHARSLRDNRSYRAAFTRRNHPRNPAAGDPPMTTTAGLQIVPRPPAAAPALRAADRGVADALESVLSDNTRRVYGAQWRLFNDWCDSVVLRSLPAEPLTVARYLAARAGAGASIATLRLATSAIAKGTRMGRTTNRPAGTGRARGVEGMGPAVGQAPAPGRRPHRRRAGRDPAHRRPTPPAAAASKRPRRPPSAPASTWPWWPSCPTGVAAFRGGGADLGRRAALGRRQRPHHRDPLQDRRRGCWRRGGHHPRRHAGPGRHPAGGGWWCGEGVRAVGVADRPAGEGDRQGRRPWPTGSSSAATAGGWVWPGAWPRTARPPTRSNARAAGRAAW